MLVAGIKMRNIERSAVSNQVHLEQSLAFKGQVTKHADVNGFHCHAINKLKSVFMRLSTS